MDNVLTSTTWSRAWIIEATLWINQKHGCCGPGCGHGWWHHVTEWVGCPDFSLITLQDQRAISWGGWEVFSVPVSLHQHQRKISTPCLSVCECVNGRICSSFIPPPSLCLKACITEKRKRWDVVIVTMPQLLRLYSGGVWPSGEVCCLCVGS